MKYSGFYQLIDDYFSLRSYLMVLVILGLFVLLPTTIWAGVPEAGGDTTVVHPSGEGPVSINEDAPQPEAANIRLIVPNLVDPAGGTPNSIRILSVTGGEMQTGGGSSITLGSNGSILSLSSSRIDLRFKPASNRDTNATFQYVVVDPHDNTVNSPASTAIVPITAVNDTPILQTFVGGTGTGLAATYYLTEWDLTGSTYFRIDPTVNFSNNFGVPGMNNEQFSVRWTGKVKSPITGNVTFSTQSDDGVRLWVNGQHIIDNWTLHGTTTDTAAPMALVEGELYDIRMEFYERGGGEVAILQWAYPGQGTQVIPQAYLYPATVRPALKFINGSSAVVVDDAQTIEDVDNTTMASASAEISGNYQSGEDSLQFVDQNGITGEYADGLLTLFGTASVAHYQLALRSIKYYNSNSSPNTSTRTIRFRVHDGSDFSNYVMRNIEFSGENNPPVITEGASVSVTMDEDSSPTPFSLTLNATDADEHSIAWSVSSPASYGTASVGEPGNSVSVSYVPNANYYGSDSFVVQASDGVGGTDTITVSVTITDRTPPIISSRTASATSTTTATVTWVTDEPASTKVSYGVTASYGQDSSETNTSPRVTSHSKSLTNLLSCTKYHYKIVTTDALSNTAQSSDGTFVTQGCPADTIPSSIESSSVLVTDGGTTTSTSDGNTITVTFPEDVTDEGSSFVVQIKALPQSTVLDVLGKPRSSIKGVGVVVFDVTAIINGTTILESFDVPVTITYQYSEDDIAGLDVSSMWLYHYTGGKWEALDDCTLNQSTKTITCTTPSFSVFALFANPVASSVATSVATATNNLSSSSQCQGSKPEGVPNLFQISSAPTEAVLYFTPVSSATGYSIHYGTDHSANQHGTAFEYTDSSGVVAHLIRDLLPNTTYYFKVQAHNGCAAGGWSQVAQTTTTMIASNLSSPHGFVAQATSKGSLEVATTQKNLSLRITPPF